MELAAGVVMCGTPEAAEWEAAKGAYEAALERQRLGVEAPGHECVECGAPSTTHRTVESLIVWLCAGHAAELDAELDVEHDAEHCPCDVCRGARGEAELDADIDDSPAPSGSLDADAAWGPGDPDYDAIPEAFPGLRICEVIRGRRGPARP